MTRLATIALVLACKGRPLMESGSASPQPSASTSAARANAPTDARSDARTENDTFAAWMPQDVEKAWQGAWLLRFQHEGPLLAVNVVGETATIYDGNEEKQVPFRVTEPCAAAFGRDEIQFLVRDGVVRPGLGAVAITKGQTAAVCGDGHDPDAPEEGVYIVSANTCMTWKRDARAVWSSRSAICVWSNIRGDDLLDVGTEHYHSMLVVKDGFAEERDFTRSAKEMVRAASWDDARSTALAKRGTPDRVDLAKAAGGVVGDTTTIAGLHATYAQHPASLVGGEFEIAGTLLELSPQANKTTLAVITDPANPKSLQLTCEIAGKAPKLSPGTPVVVKGAIDTRFDYARLRRCTITK